MAFLGGAFCGLILGGVFGLILGCCLASASKEDEYLKQTGDIKDE